MSSSLVVQLAVADGSSITLEACNFAAPVLIGLTAPVSAQLHSPTTDARCDAVHLRLHTSLHCRHRSAVERLCVMHSTTESHYAIHKELISATKRSKRERTLALSSVSAARLQVSCRGAHGTKIPPSITKCLTTSMNSNAVITT